MVIWGRTGRARNYGENVEVLEGVTAKDQLVLNPSDSLAEGDAVAIAPPATAPAEKKDVK
jgi:hypothetical protein